MGEDCFHFSVRHPKIKFSGFGTSFDEKLALKIAINECLERHLYMDLRSRGVASTTSGIAVHDSNRDAMESALCEHLERDALLTHWLLKIPPVWLKSYEFSQLNRSQIALFASKGFNIRFGLNSISNGRFCVIASLSFVKKVSKFGYAFSSSCNKSLDGAIASTIMELRRTATILHNRIANGEELWDEDLTEINGHYHFCHYANKNNCKDLGWLFEKNNLLVHQYNFNVRIEPFRLSIIPTWPIFGAQAKCDETQDFYFGPAEYKRINRKRLRAHWRVGIKLNKSLHCLP